MIRFKHSAQPVSASASFKAEVTMAKAASPLSIAACAGADAERPADNSIGNPHL